LTALLPREPTVGEYSLRGRTCHYISWTRQAA
jgi:hypothetical protein